MSIFVTIIYVIVDYIIETCWKIGGIGALSLPMPQGMLSDLCWKDKKKVAGLVNKVRQI